MTSEGKNPLSKIAAVNQERRRIDELKPAEYNPRKRLRPGDEEYERLKRSIEAFGYVDPIIINADGTVIGGHQRLFVLQDLGYQEADVAVVDLNKADEKALNIALNKIDGDWDQEKLAAIFADLEVDGYDLNLTGFTAEEIQQIGASIATSVERDLMERPGAEMWEFGSNEESEEYEEYMDSEQQEKPEVDFSDLDSLTGGKAAGYDEFIEKFKPKKTTDDCYTPVGVYDAVKNWVLEEYKIGPEREIIRPFYPGGDYQKYEYPAGCVVIDNPPFSILSEILDFYNENDIDYFLFAPTLTMFCGNRPKSRFIVNYYAITYENEAKVNTSFITNMDEYKIRIDQELSRRIKEAQPSDNDLPKYDYPLNVITAARLGKLARAGVELKIKPEQCAFIRELDEQKEYGKALYGGGFLISDGAAAEKSAAEKSEEIEAQVWHLSERERDIIEALNKYDE